MLLKTFKKTHFFSINRLSKIALRKLSSQQNRRLEDIVNLKKLEQRETPEIKEIWHKHHEKNLSKSVTTLTVDEYEKIVANGKIGKRFIFPVPLKDKNFFVLYSEFQDNYVIMTSLEAFRRELGNSYPYYIASFYDELLDSRDISLVRGEVLNNLMEVSQGKFVLKTLIDFYLREELFEKVKQFNSDPKGFDVKKHFLDLGFSMNGIKGR